MHNNSKTPPPITPGPVSLSVANLDASVAFYREHVGLKLHGRNGRSARLGAGGPDLLRLVEKRGARKVLRTTGLYHFALLLPSRLDLARVLRHFAEQETVLSGMADHAVSEAVYLSDPDGHGIEIYRDRPQTEWEYPDGRLKLTTEPLHVAAILDTLQGSDRPWQGLPPRTVMGHIHLHVSDISAAEHFYGDLLGLDVMARYGRGASFMASGGYHHHVGLNTWNGVGAPPPPPDSLRLETAVLHVHPDLLPEVVARLETAVVPLTHKPDGWHLNDPAGTPLILTETMSIP